VATTGFIPMRTVLVVTAAVVVVVAAVVVVEAAVVVAEVVVEAAVVVAEVEVVVVEAVEVADLPGEIKSGILYGSQRQVSVCVLICIYGTLIYVVSRDDSIIIRIIIKSM